MGDRGPELGCAKRFGVAADVVVPELVRSKNKMGVFLMETSLYCLPQKISRTKSFVRYLVETVEKCMMKMGLLIFGRPCNLGERLPKRDRGELMQL